MNFSAPLRVRIERDVIVRIQRNLKGKGAVSVALNQQVAPSDIIATSQISKGFRTLNLAQLLNVSPGEAAKYLKKSIGQRVYKDELLALKSNWLSGKKVVTSPADGVFDFLDPKTGELRLVLFPKKEDMPAGVYGIVEEVDAQRGQVTIRIQATIVHGVFGSGRVRDGILRVIGKRDQLIEKATIIAKPEEQILLGGSLVFKDAIYAAIYAGVSGIITGGINAKDYKDMAGGRLVFPKKIENDIGISIIVCEGFGSIPIGLDIYQTLERFNSRFVSIDGNAGMIILPSFESISIEKVKKTKLPPIQENILGIHKHDFVELKIGQNTRIVGNSYQGEQGKIIALDFTETLMPSGIKTYMATIETNRRTIQVPVANIEVIL